jgi:hypothetical protein
VLFPFGFFLLLFAVTGEAGRDFFVGAVSNRD